MPILLTDGLHIEIKFLILLNGNMPIRLLTKKALGRGIAT